MDLRQSTATQIISLGQFLDSTDGDTEENGLTIANTDIKLRKNGATTLANKNSGGATNISNGVYHATLDATDSNTLGRLEIYVHVAGALAVKSVFRVLTASAFDAIYTGTFNNLGGVAQSEDNDTKISAIPTTAMRGTEDAALATNLAALDSKVDDIQGVTFSTSTDSLEAIRNRGDVAWTTGAGGSSPTVEEIRIEMDDNSTKLLSIVDDTNELQGDWVDGGRLDLILDARASQTSLNNLNNISASDVWNNSTRTLTSFTFTVNCDVKQINGATVLGNGTSGNLWRGS